MTEKTLEQKRKVEFAYYRDLYKNHGYRRGSKRHIITDNVCMKHGSRKGWTTWLDVGAGEHKIMVPSRIKKFVRTDPGHPDTEDRHPIHEIVNAYGENSFDVVSSFDVLEHLLPEELDEGIMCLWNVCEPGGVVIVSVGTDLGGPWNGRPTHLTIKPMEWWKILLDDLYGEVVHHVATSKGTSPFFVIHKPA